MTGSRSVSFRRLEEGRRCIDGDTGLWPVLAQSRSWATVSALLLTIHTRLLGWAHNMS